MAGLTPKDVDEIAALARLALSDSERETLRIELAAVLTHIDVLAALDTKGVEPMTHAVPMTLRLRDDTIEPSLPATVATKAAPDHADGLFIVPKIVSKGMTGQGES